MKQKQSKAEQNKTKQSKAEATLSMRRREIEGAGGLLFWFTVEWREFHSVFSSHTDSSLYE